MAHEPGKVALRQAPPGFGGRHRVHYVSDEWQDVFAWGKRISLSTGSTGDDVAQALESVRKKTCKSSLIRKP